jgi:hypothetical protein
VTAQKSSKTSEEKYGFRNTKFGTEQSEIHNLVAVNSTPYYQPKENETLYTQEGENLQIDKQKADKIIYLFYKHQLKAVFITSQKPAYDEIRSLLKVNYGTGGYYMNHDYFYINGGLIATQMNNITYIGTRKFDKLMKKDLSGDLSKKELTKKQQDSIIKSKKFI